MSEVIVITSGKGGVGKTTTSAKCGNRTGCFWEKGRCDVSDIGLRTWT